MLTVLYGPSCVGKTSVQQALISKHGWLPVRCFTTRPPRPNDVGRVSVSREEFALMEADERFALVNVQFGELYGTSKEDIYHSNTPGSGYFVLDFRISDSDQLSHFQHQKILLCVENVGQLERQIAAAGRLNRREAILEEFFTHYAANKLLEYSRKGFALVTNHDGALDITCADIESLCKRT